MMSIRLTSGLLAVLALATPTFAQDFPRTVHHAFGDTVIESEPKRILALSDADFDILLGLGIKPIASANAGYDNAPTSPYHDQYMAGFEGEEVQFFSLWEGVPFETILAADPDLILATGAWSLDTDYERLSAIAPVVAFEDGNSLTTTWQGKTRTAAKALALEDEAEALIGNIEARFAEAAAANPAFAGKTIAYGVVHPDQFTYMSVVGDTSTTFFDLLGFELTETAAQFDSETSAVSRERLDMFDADVLLFAFPFEGDAFIDQAELEADLIFGRVPAVAGGRYVVVPQIVASSLAYPSPLSTLWALEELLPLLQQASAK
jgi:iron complex transport system substrate-binding protein